MNIFINLNINSLYHKDILGPRGCVLPNSSKSTKDQILHNPKKSQDVNKT